MKKYLVKTRGMEQTYDSADQVRDALFDGKIRSGDWAQAFGESQWSHVADLPEIAPLFSTMPTSGVERAANVVFVPGARPYQAGPFTLSELKTRLARGEFAPASWVSLEGGHWQQIRSVPPLREAVPPLPGMQPNMPPPGIAPPVSAPPVPGGGFELALDATMGEPSVKLDLKEAMELESAALAAGSAPVPPPPVIDDGVEREDPTLAISTLGLNLEPAPVPAPPVQAAPPLPPALAVSKDKSDFDGITVEIPMDPIWLIKQGTSENVAGPFRFLEVVDFLKKGKLHKNDKISKAGTNRFQKITQQYEFNVGYSVENVVRGGMETKKIFIHRRHPRADYMADVQVTRQGRVFAGQCINISAGGVMVEIPKVDLEIGEALQIKILPALIPRQILCGATVTGKIGKIPPGFALKFDTLTSDDKEAIEYFVTEALKREQAGKQNAV